MFFLFHRGVLIGGFLKGIILFEGSGCFLDLILYVLIFN